MRKLLLLLILASNAFGAALVQQAAGGAGSASYTSGSGSHILNTSTASFGSNTGAGNTLICVVWFRENGGVGGLIYSNLAVTTPGITWLTHPGVYGAFEDNATATKLGEVFVYYVVGASSVSSATTTSLAATIPAPNTATYQLEFSLFEFSGIASLNAIGYLASNDTGTVSNPFCATTFPSTSLFLCASVAYPGSNLTAVGSYALGPNAGTATIGQSSYYVAALGSQTTQYTGTLGLWATIGISFNLTGATSGVPRHRGFVN